MMTVRHARWSRGPDGRVLERAEYPIPTTTLLMSRLPIYQPTQRPVFLRGEWFETAWGRARVTGRLGQRHDDVMECLLHSPRSARVTDDGGIEVLVDPAELRRKMGRQYSAERLGVLLNDLRVATVQIETKKLLRGTGAMLDHIIECDPGAELQIFARAPAGWAGAAPRRWWRVRLGTLATLLLLSDLCLTRDPRPFRALPHGITQAVARLIATHRDEPTGGWRIDELIHAVSGQTLQATALRNRRRELRSDREQLAAVGLQLDRDRVRRTKPSV